MAIIINGKVKRNLQEQVLENAKDIEDIQDRLSEKSDASNIENGTGEGSLQQKGNTASGIASHAEGNDTKSQGAASHSEGTSTTASGDYSHAGGRSSEARGESSFAHGQNIYVNQSCQVGFGKFNRVDPNTLFVIGNGTSSSTSGRSNAFEVYQDGTIKAKNVNVSNEITNGTNSVTVANIAQKGQTIIGTGTFSSGSCSFSNVSAFTDGLYFFTYGNCQAFGILTSTMLAASSQSPITIPMPVIYSGGQGSSRIGQLKIVKVNQNSIALYLYDNQGVQVQDGFQITVIKTNLA